MTAIARGRITSTWRVLVIFASSTSVLFMVCSLVLVFTEFRDEEPAEKFYVGMGFALFGACFGLIWLVVTSGLFWLANPARVSYEVSGTRVIARKCGNEVKTIDMTEWSSIEVQGLDGWRFALWSGIGGLYWMDLPQIVFRRSELSRIGVEALPAVLELTPGSTNHMRTLLHQALAAGGVEVSKLERLNFRQRDLSFGWLQRMWEMVNKG